ncbi:MAG: hypothetical protein ACREO3_01025, partial [Arenimonas sp.]
LQRYGQIAASGTVLAEPDVEAACGRLAKIKADIKALEQNEEAEKAVILKALGDRGDTLADTRGRVLATWKLAKAPTRLDAKALAVAHPTIHSQFTVDGTPSRRLLLKETTA